MDFRYCAILARLPESSKALILFSAPATDIGRWAGVPQKRRFGGGEETTGFQREESPARIESLKQFYLDPENIIQNPLLCANRQVEGTSVEFSPERGPDDGGPCGGTDAVHGQVTIQMEDLDELSLVEMLGRVRNGLETRVPELAQKVVAEAVISSLKRKAQDAGEIAQAETLEDPDQDPESGVPEEDQDDSDGESEAAAAFFEESHILDFWQEVAARHELLRELGDGFDGDEFLGFTKEALLGYLLGWSS